MKRWLGFGALALLLAGLGGFLARDRIALTIYQRGAAQAMAADTLASLPDGLHAAFCGTGSPMPDPERAGPCLAIIAGKRLIVVDAGEGAARNLQLMGLPAARIDRVLLTHFHSDHIDGLGPLGMQRWVNAHATQPLILQGPVGVGEVAAGFNGAYRQDSTYRTAHHGAALVPPSGFGFSPRAFALQGGRGVVLNEGGLKITAFDVDHSPVHPAVGYRFDYKGRCITVSGDTAPSEAVAQMAKDCDLLVHEALQPRLTRVLVQAAKDAGNTGLAQLLSDIETYHTTPEQAADIAQKAGVKALALTHIVPPLRLRGLEGEFLGDARGRFHGELWIASDRDLLSLPATGGMTRSTLGGR
ncbi:MBL fold metallo-hydrolase [Sandaracinobacter neustonicus]|uniref:MBL fold metallo-hydrolase n=1 Tax=Sandaracinobacter neustonicus TaxID=1715348 RepID=A0A501XMU8_9SPHN|nr:MBL fold metallo-hydrolase [Sandaracinobacter neustonicus]TPE61765.1 MBL fold metallo-hydrolase [Sandaracinobacter neustonicus]